uniref:HEAT repeat-containing protein 6 n=1 Tax=Nothobranchius korthausae TaxID=1143690 RepID=A0A1A8FTX3_9TELE
MAASTPVGLSSPAFCRRAVPSHPSVALSAEAAPFTPLLAGRSHLECLSDAEKQFSRCAAKLRALRTDSNQLREELNQLFDQLLSENYNRAFDPVVNIRSEDVCVLLKHVCTLVPLGQEHLVAKFCQLVHHLLNQLKLILDEHTLDVLVKYTSAALKECSTWTHSDVLLAVSTVVYGNGFQCHQFVSNLLCEDGVLLQYSSPCQPNIELRRVALTCMANICLRIPGQQPLDDQYRSACFGVFLKTLHSPKPPDTDDLFYCMDPLPKVRLCALQVLSAILDSSRQFLAVAEDTASPRTSYTPFSFTLATAIRELHRSLSLALLAETSSQTLTQVIKCLAFLVSNAPYHRLRPGLLSQLWKQIRPYVRHRDATVRVSVLTLYGALVTTQAPLPEVQLLLQQPEESGCSFPGSFTPQDSSLSWRQRSGAASPARTPAASSQRSSCTQSPRLPQTPGEGESSPPWLLKLCVLLVTQPRENQSDSEGAGGGSVLEPPPVRLAALQVLSYLVRGYFSLTQSSMGDIGQVSARCLGETDSSIQLHGAKLLEEFGTGVILQYRAESNIPESSRIPVYQVVQFWSEVLSGPLNGALQNEQDPILQASACDTLASILPQAFAQLPDKTQLMCITMLLGLTYVENYLVKMAAVRALGVYILFPCLREDVMFVADTANIILAAIEDRSRNVRFKAAWSLANLTDTLIINMQSVGVDFQEELSDMLLLKMLQAATQASTDKDKVKSNAVRVLGNLLHFLRDSQMTRSAFQRPLEDAVRALIRTVLSDATMKVRWNACYALGNAFRNPTLPLDSAPWSHDAFAALCHVVISCENFKVRIKSAAALAVPARRDCYGDTKRFGRIWHSLATALENSEDTNDFLEYRYSASLRHTLSQALLHLLSVSELQDMPIISASLAGEEGRGIKVHLIKYLKETEGGGEKDEEAEGERNSSGTSCPPQQRIAGVQQTLIRLKELKPGGEGVSEERGQEMVILFLEDLLKMCEEF